MKTTSITLCRTFNIGNYESIEVGLTVEVDDHDPILHTTEKLNERLCSMRESLSAKYRKACNIVNSTEGTYSDEDLEEAKAYIEEVCGVFD